METKKYSFRSLSTAAQKGFCVTLQNQFGISCSIEHSKNDDLSGTVLLQGSEFGLLGADDFIKRHIPFQPL